MFLNFSLMLVSSFKPLWSKKMLDMISIFLSLLRLVLFCTMLSIFENVPVAFERNVYFASLGWRFCIYQLSHLILSVVQCHNICVESLLGRSIHCWQWAVKISYYDCVTIDIFLEVLQDFPYIFECSYVGWSTSGMFTIMFNEHSTLLAIHPCVFDG